MSTTDKPTIDTVADDQPEVLPDAGKRPAGAPASRRPGSGDGAGDGAGKGEGSGDGAGGSDGSDGGSPRTEPVVPTAPAAGDGGGGDRGDGELDSWDEGDGWDAGVTAPGPSRTKSRRQKRKEWRQSERARRYAARRSVRFPIFTRAILLWMLLFAMIGVASGGTAAYFWAHFNTQIEELREQTRDFDKRSQDASAQIDAMRNQAVTDINNQLKPIIPLIAETQITQLAVQFSPYVWLVATYDENGMPSTGTAFPVASDETTTLMVTSLHTVRAASVTPAPEIELRKTSGDSTDYIKATVVNYDADRDLALLSVQRGGMQVLDWATDEQQSQALGDLVFVASGFGGAGASLTDGRISDASAAGYLHNAKIGNYAQGAPIVTADAKIMGVASIQYRPLGFDPGEMHFSISINQVCIELLECGGGARRAKTEKKPPAPARPPTP